MVNVFSLQQPLYSIFWNKQQILPLRRIALIAGGTLLLTLASKCTVPLHPVPVTLQTLAVFFLALTYGWRLAGTTLLTYVTLGLIGLPVFAPGVSGPAILLDPTAGYILGWFPATFLAGWLAQHGWGKHFISVLVAQLLASIVMYGFGLTVLSLYVGWHQSITLGLTPFLLGDSLKMIFLACVVPAFWRRAESQQTLLPRESA